MRKAVTVGIVLLLVLMWVPFLSASPIDQMDKRINELQGSIDAGVKSGSLTQAESKKLQTRLDAIRKNFDAQRKRGLSDQEFRSLNKRIDDLRKDIFKEKHDSQTARSGEKIAKRINEIQRRIESGERTGSLTAPEAKNLQSRLNRHREQFEKANRDTLTDSEIKSIERNLDALSKEITKQLKNKHRYK
jgi:septal ring factor EnvC (AmiA/AmiB activator)